MQADHVLSMTLRRARSWMAALLALVALFAASPIGAQFGGEGPHIKAKLTAESADPAPRKTVWLAFEMSPDKGWHGYWENPGDAGIGMSVDWTLPEGVSAGELVYPVPETLSIAGIMNYVYEGRYAVLVPLTIADSVAPGTNLPIAAKADWLACTDEVCVPESGRFATSLTAGDGSVDAARRAAFDGYRTRLAQPLSEAATYSNDGKTVRISIPFPKDAAIEEPYFFPRTDGVIDYSAEQKISRTDDAVIIETAARGDSTGPISGILKIGEHAGLDLTAEPGKVGAAGVAMGDGGSGALDGDPFALFAIAFGGAFLGGLMLNVFPCVFPILSLKAISLAKAGGDERAAKRDAIAYTLGITVFCVALGGAMLGLRAFGEGVGWGFQLQDPRIIFVLLLLVTAIAFNLAGLFEFSNIGIGQSLASQGGARGAFWTGALAALVATPCSAPFMGSAIGAALVLPAAAGLLVFVGLGLGLAFPFLLIGFVPALRRRMPRPGAWMDTFRKIMAVPMFLTALALLWLLGQLSGSTAILYGLGAAMLVALLLWWVGLRQHGGKAMSWLPLAPALAIAVAALLALPASDGAAAAGASAENKVLASEPYSAERLAALQAEGRPVFAYFTADWCITCKVNEASAVQQQATADAFRAGNVAVLEGDWTRRDPEITRYLEEHGRAGVPFYVYYDASGKQTVLPQTLTVSTLTGLVG